jgi:hypothetical protein
VTLVATASLGAEDVAVPAEVQAQLLAKVISFDRAQESRDAQQVTILLVAKPENALSEKMRAEIAHALSQQATMGSLPHREVSVTWSGPEALVSRIKSDHASVVYLMPGLSDGELQQVGSSLNDLNVLTVDADAAAVPSGVVLGFDLVSGRPRIVINLKQARTQKVDFSSRLLSFAKVLQ